MIMAISGAATYDEKVNNVKYIHRNLVSLCNALVYTSYVTGVSAVKAKAVYFV